VHPRDRDQIEVGSVARIRFSSFNQRTTPQLNGKVILIAPDLVSNQRTGEAFYVVRITLDEGEIERLGGKKLVPGMPAEVQITTGERVALSFLVKPLQDQISKAFRER